MCGSPGPAAQSPSPSRVRSSLHSKFTVFTRQKGELESNLHILEGRSNDKIQPDSVKVQCLDLKTRLASLGVSWWVSSSNLAVDFPDIWDRIDPVELCNWEDLIGKKLQIYTTLLKKK